MFSHYSLNSFFFLCGSYKLRPIPNNPYLRVDTDEDEPAEEVQLESISTPHKRKGTTPTAEP